MPPLQLSLDQLVPLHKSYQNFSQHLWYNWKLVRLHASPTFPEPCFCTYFSTKNAIFWSKNCSLFWVPSLRSCIWLVRNVKRSTLQPFFWVHLLYCQDLISLWKIDSIFGHKSFLIAGNQVSLYTSWFWISWNLIWAALFSVSHVLMCLNSVASVQCILQPS